MLLSVFLLLNLALALADDPLTVDLDGDGWCENGVDLDGDGDCTHPSEYAPIGDCDETGPDAAQVHPYASEAAGGPDRNCDGGVGDDDLDGDGVVASLDCDDADPFTHPGAIELCWTGRDEDCSGGIDDAPVPQLQGLYWMQWAEDADGDGFPGLIHATVPSSCRFDMDVLPLGYFDCDDSDPQTHPLASDLVDRDRDCDGIADGGDRDGDGYDSMEDCDDLDAARNPGAVEVYDGSDNDCDGWADEGLAPPEDAELVPVDRDLDGSPDATRQPGWLAAPWWVHETGNHGPADCDDGDPTIHALDLDRDGRSLCDGDCDDGDARRSPASEEIPGNAVDEDCDELLACFTDADGDGAGVLVVDVDAASCASAAGFASLGGDCDDGDAAISPEADEVVGNAVDEDCDGRLACYRDRDGDGFGVAREVRIEGTSCDSETTAARLGDCDDRDATVSPDATDFPGNGIDEDCSGADAREAGPTAPEPLERIDCEGCDGGGLGPAWLWLAAVVGLRRSRSARAPSRRAPAAL